MNHLNAEPETTVDFLQKLRAETAASHLKLEDLPISKAILSPDVTIFEYGSYLAFMYDVIRDVEKTVFPVVSAVITDSDKRKKRHFLEADFSAIAFSKPEIETVFHQKFNIPFALGIIYVIEGSSLGGRVILKNLKKTLPHSEENGMRYFAGYGDATGSHWKSFLEMFTDYERNNGGSDEIIAGAAFAFDTIYEHLSKFEHEV